MNSHKLLTFVLLAGLCGPSRASRRDDYPRRDLNPHEAARCETARDGRVTVVFAGKELRATLVLLSRCLRRDFIVDAQVSLGLILDVPVGRRLSRTLAWRAWLEALDARGLVMVLNRGQYRIVVSSCP